MPRDEEITFADHLGRFYARRYAFPPMAGRVLGYLLVCDPPDQTIAELSEALLASRSAVTGALDVLERTDAVRRSRSAGERMDRVRVDFSSPRSRGFDVSEYQELGDLAREGLQVLKDASPERRATLVEMAAFADWLVERTRALQQEWEAHSDALRASGELPGKD
jgi:DNA-binding transcriptional regulator GbsR (MarR family)